MKDGGGTTSASGSSLAERNAEYWDELCGTWFALAQGIPDASPESLRRFDEAYFKFYPYLRRYLPDEAVGGRRVLEAGLGYGTVGQLLAECGFQYTGIDIAPGPVEMMARRLAHVGCDDCEARLASVLDIPCPEDHFDYVVSIGCLHHTGDIPRAIAELRRVLKPGGRLMVMLYNARSLRRLALRARQFVSSALPVNWRVDKDHILRRYDSDLAGNAPPHTEFTSVLQARRLFAAFDDVRIERQNIDVLSFARGRVVIPRERMLGNLGRLAGADLYITAHKPAA
jgi:SAM-dependent methyltransferase